MIVNAAARSRAQLAAGAPASLTRRLRAWQTRLNHLPLCAHAPGRHVRAYLGGAVQGFGMSKRFTGSRDRRFRPLLSTSSNAARVSV